MFYFQHSTEASVLFLPNILQSGGSTSSMGEKKNTNTKRQKPSSIGDDPMMLKPTLPHGFV